jgi:hypothetical protein
MPSRDSHLSDDFLLMELEGELSPRDLKSVRAHLEACWRCRARRQELERSIADFMRAYQQEFDGQLPPAAGPRALLKAHLAEISAGAPNQPPRWFAAWDRPLRLAAICALSVLAVVWAANRFGAALPSAPREPQVSTPDSTLTPGATVLVSASDVCSQANVKNKQVSPSTQRLVFQEYGLVRAQTRAYEVDYLVTPALGGSDDIRNLWPHSYSSVWNARVKDALEDRMREMVCGGQLDLAQAQREIAANWIEAYKKYFHTDHPLAAHQ